LPEGHDAAEPATQQAVLQRWTQGCAATARAGVRESRSRSMVETIALDITTIRRSAGRLQSCLVTTPLAALESGAADVVRQSLGELAGVLRTLEHTLAGALGPRAAPEIR